MDGSVMLLGLQAALLLLWQVPSLPPQCLHPSLQSVSPPLLPSGPEWCWPAQRQTVPHLLNTFGSRMGYWCLRNPRTTVLSATLPIAWTIRQGSWYGRGQGKRCVWGGRRVIEPPKVGKKGKQEGNLGIGIDHPGLSGGVLNPTTSVLIRDTYGRYWWRREGHVKIEQRLERCSHEQRWQPATRSWTKQGTDCP